LSDAKGWASSIKFTDDPATKRLRSSGALSQVRVRDPRAGSTRANATVRDVLQIAVRRLSSEDHFVGDAAAEITVLRDIANKVPIAEACTEIPKAIAVLRARWTVAHTDGRLLSRRAYFWQPSQFVRAAL
jgi:hypothetical protein